MKYCVIATKDQRDYLAVVCHYDDMDLLCALLCESFSHADAALGLVSLGDIAFSASGTLTSYHRDFGYSWAQCCPVVLEGQEALLAHGRAIGAQGLFLFNGEQWHHKLLASEISEISEIKEIEFA